MPKLTVITIVYNNVRDIERTINSVLNQTYTQIEYIIIDGKSTDGTLAIIETYKSKISKIVSEPDKGIYDAMNKGLALATGDYVLFMNSGDEIYDEQTVEDVFASAPGADIYYGETEMYNDNWESLGRRRHEAPEKFDWKSFKYGMNISHQAIYIRRNIIAPYDLTYKYSSDIDWIIKAAKKASSIVNVHRYVAKYLVGGMSKKKHRESLKERFNIFTKYYGLIPNIFNHLVIAGNLAFYFVKHRRTND
ncbi:glycosyl transferase family 2 [Pedobacter sp. Leaf41]|jgi:glycosyltransferase involved in cell wall biosynthesis|uniref:glycosyltransferase family 2 protein n=1 Tax=Pedobacter sp. Leaf41 TaxID=1736218 RepID=UPI000702E846|nr:glycosyltransferase family 2 protein [Pedobacter sp. Leaf41]KQN34651.1 glycosyl transferase family 2 [Pedobacter sp. Leaf41]RZL34701.1 MAG: glycosyltransferase [Pedobacter sp.]